MSGALTVAVDFGTTNTVAVASRDGSAPRVVSVDGAPYLPSAVLLGEDGQLVVGNDALRLGRSAAHRLEPRPKSRLDEESLLLGGTPVDVLQAVRAVLHRVCTEAARQADRPVGHLVLTHPADWGAMRMGRLSRAATGLAPRLSLVPEPVAAAARAGLPEGAAELVVDLGGGTSDAAVVRHNGAGFTVLACAGLPDLGGDDLDQRIIDRVRGAYPELAPSVPSTMDLETIRRDRLLRQDARAAKELLSRHESAKLTVPGLDEPVELSRAWFEAVIEPDLRRVVDLARRVLDEAWVDRSALRGVHLVGGTSRIPRLTALLGAELRLPVHPDPEPEAGVAWGAIELATAADSAAPTAPAALPGRPAAIVHGGQKAAAPRWLAGGVALVVVIALVVTGVLLSGGQQVGGNPVAASGAPSRPASPPRPPSGSASVPAFPPVRPGEPVVGAGVPTPVLVSQDGTGLFKGTPPLRGATEVQEEVRLVQAEVTQRPAPPGYRWAMAKVEVTLRVGDELPYGDGHNVYLVDDRDQLVDSASRAGPTTLELCGSDQQKLPQTPKGQSRTECAAFLVPNATAVKGVLFNDRLVDPLGDNALLFTVSMPATGRTDPPDANGRVGGSPVEVPERSTYAAVGIADVIDKPSAYLVDPKPPPGIRLFVVRYTVGASGAGTVLTHGITSGLHLLDDRGLLVPADPHIDYDQQNCPTLTKQLTGDAVSQGCLVFGLDQDSSISRIVYQPEYERDDPARWVTWELPG